jgi:superfamily II DNA/RNA helicase
MNNINNTIATVLPRLGISSLNAMQERFILESKKGQDIILLSPTGSGKTLAFLLPVLAKLSTEIKATQAIVITPSRELALQIEQVFRQMSTGFGVLCCYGGHAISLEKKSLQSNPALIIGTPGRLADLIDNQFIKTEHIHTLVLDEFDKSLEFGFSDDMSFIIRQLRHLKQRFLTSATESLDIPAFTGITHAARLDFLSDHSTLKGLSIKRVLSDDRDKLQTLYRLLCLPKVLPALVFCNHREASERISFFLSDNHIANEFFHGGKEQDDRERVLCKFRNGSCNVLISTDLAARGLDIPEIQSIIHYHLPVDESSFTHRNGRTARMMAEGTAYVILCDHEVDIPYLADYREVLRLPETTEQPAEPVWKTLCIGKGKRDKISKADVAGFLMQKGNISKEDIGRIEVKDFISYAAINKGKVKALLNTIGEQKIKGIKAKFWIEG